MSNPDCMFEFHDEKTFGKLPNDDEHDSKYYEYESSRQGKKKSGKKKSNYEYSMPRRTIYITDKGPIYKNKDKQQKAEQTRSKTNNKKYDRYSKYAQYYEITKRGCRCADIINNMPPLHNDFHVAVCAHCIDYRCRFCLSPTDEANTCDDCLRFMRQYPKEILVSYW